MTISHEAFTMYIFHPMLSKPIGIMKTKTRLRFCQLIVYHWGEGPVKLGTGTYARLLSINCENATPFARIE